MTFTGHEFSEGGYFILKTLEDEGIKASFFFTGDFYRNEKFTNLIERLKQHGHYLGAHSDRHLLYNDWTKEKNLLISRDSFMIDLKDNYKEMKRFGISKREAHYFLPPYEWNDSTITKWTKESGLSLINLTRGTLSHTDYTTPEDSNYRNNEEILNSIYNYDTQNGLHGFILLSHLGTDPKRKEKFYLELPGLIKNLKKRGYTFCGLNELLREQN